MNNDTTQPREQASPDTLWRIKFPDGAVAVIDSKPADYMQPYATAYRIAPVAAPEAPIQMILNCPKCGKQHVDEPETYEVTIAEGGVAELPAWTNPPHRSHLCHGCGHIWRPADVPTEGVKAIQTRGKADSPLVPEVAASEQQAQADRVVEWSAAKATTASADHNSQEPNCSCPSGTASLSWPCPVHPAEATTASASDGSIYESVSRRANPVGHAEAMAQLDEVLGRATAPSRNAAPLPKPVVDGVDESAFQHAWEYMVDGTDTIDAGWLRRFVATYCEASESSALAEQYSDVLRKICFEHSAGGYNSEGLMSPEAADAKIRWIIDDTRRAALTQQSATPSRDVILETAVQAVSERAGDADKVSVASVYEAIRACKTNRHALPESCSAQQSAAQPCPTCGGSKVDPGGLPICRGCGGAAQESHAGADTERLDWLMKNNSDASLKIRGADSMGWFVYNPNTDTSSRLFATSRETIDAAMSAATEQKEKP